MAYRRLVCSVTCLLCALFLFAGDAHSQTAEKLSQIKKVYVAYFGASRNDTEMRAQIERRLRKTRDFQISLDPKSADAILMGTTRIWTTGSASLSPRPHGPTESVTQGYLSVELLGRNNQILWSYLVTPSKFPWGGITEDLARQLVGRLVTQARENGSEPPSTAASLPAAPVNLQGAGGTFPAPLYQKWFELFGQDYAGLHVTYNAVGSAEGIRQLRGGTVDFGASDMPLTDQAMAETGRRWVQVPIILGAVVPIYNVAHQKQALNFTAEILAGIYLGHIKRWNDPEIKRANRGASLPDAEIVVVHRSDGSGTTYVWSDYLSKVNPEWKNSVGSNVQIAWPTGIGAEYNEGVASKVRSMPNSIGYVEFIYAMQHELTFGAVENSAGEFVRADIASVREAARSGGTPDGNLRVSITNAPGNSAYPIASYTWVLLPQHIEDKDRKTALVALLRWMLTEGQKSCSALGYAPLPPEIAKRGMELLEKNPS
jgi:phosphate transport system substrate-binding protein